MSKHYKVAAAACYVIVSGVGSVLLYRDAPVPESAENLDALEADGLIVEVESEDELGGHPSDLPPDYEHVAPGVVDGADTSADSGSSVREPEKSSGRRGSSAAKAE